MRIEISRTPLIYGLLLLMAAVAGYWLGARHQPFAPNQNEIPQAALDVFLAAGEEIFRQVPPDQLTTPLYTVRFLENWRASIDFWPSLAQPADPNWVGAPVVTFLDPDTITIQIVSATQESGLESFEMTLVLVEGEWKADFIHHRQNRIREYGDG